MSDQPTLSPIEALEAAAEAARSEQYLLILYVAGLTPRSQEAIRNVSRICEKHLAGRYTLQVIDIYQQPELAGTEQIVAAPTLLKKLPLPLRRIIGSMAESEKVLVGLGLQPVQADEAHEPP